MEFDISQRKVNYIPPYGGFSGQRTGIHHAKLLPISFAALRSLHPNIHDASLEVIEHLLTALTMHYLKVVPHKKHGHTYTREQPVISWRSGYELQSSRTVITQSSPME